MPAWQKEWGLLRFVPLSDRILLILCMFVVSNRSALACSLSVNLFFWYCCSLLCFLFRVWMRGKYSVVTGGCCQIHLAAGVIGWRPGLLETNCSMCLPNMLQHIAKAGYEIQTMIRLILRSRTDCSMANIVLAWNDCPLCFRSIDSMCSTSFRIWLLVSFQPIDLNTNWFYIELTI